MAPYLEWGKSKDEEDGNKIMPSEQEKSLSNQSPMERTCQGYQDRR